MVMNAGAGFWHEEAVLGDDPIEMLQIFVRAEAADMEAGVQFVSLDKTESIDRWLYVFRGAISVGNEQAEAHTALTIGTDEAGLVVTASREADLVLFLVDRQAPFSRAGTMSG
jgi:hypothetical protein